MSKDVLINEIEELKKELNDMQKDFLGDYNLLDINYLDDAISECADNQVYIYSSDIVRYYNNHMKEASDALLEFGYELKDFNDLEDASRKGSQLAQYLEILSELYEGNRLEELKNLLFELEELEELKE